MARNVAFFVTCLLWSSYGHADWAEFGAGARCIEGQRFTLLPTVELSSEDPGAVPLQNGYEQLEENSRFSCKVGASKVAASIKAFGPASQGMCMGAGYVSIDRLTVDDVPVFASAQPFNFNCLGSRILTKLEVTAPNDVPTVEICDAAAWGWGKGFSDIRCHHVSLAADGELNGVYTRLMASLSQSERGRLRQEQRVWLKSRDPQCQSAALAVRGSSATPLTFLHCVVSTTERRTVELQKWR